MTQCIHTVCLPWKSRISVENKDGWIRCKEKSQKLHLLLGNPLPYHRTSIAVKCQLSCRPQPPVQGRRISQKTSLSSLHNHTTVSTLSPSATIGIPSPLSGLCSTNCSCLRALMKSLTDRIRMNQPTIMSAYASHSLLVTLAMPLLVLVLAVAAPAAAASATCDGSKSCALGYGGSVGSATTSGDLEAPPRI